MAKYIQQVLTIFIIVISYNYLCALTDPSLEIIKDEDAEEGYYYPRQDRKINHNEYGKTIEVSIHPLEKDHSHELHSSDTQEEAEHYAILDAHDEPTNTGTAVESESAQGESVEEHAEETETIEPREETNHETNEAIEETNNESNFEPEDLVGTFIDEPEHTIGPSKDQSNNVENDVENDSDPSEQTKVTEDNTNSYETEIGEAVKSNNENDETERAEDNERIDIDSRNLNGDLHVIRNDEDLQPVQYLNENNDISKEISKEIEPNVTVSDEGDDKQEDELNIEEHESGIEEEETEPEETDHEEIGHEGNKYEENEHEEVEEENEHERTDHKESEHEETEHEESEQEEIEHEEPIMILDNRYRWNTRIYSKLMEMFKGQGKGLEDDAGAISFMDEPDAPRPLFEIQSSPPRSSESSDMVYTEESASVCSLPPQSGFCKAVHQRYYHNTDTNECEPFTYGGCGGNANSFETLQECVQACGHNNDL